MYNGNISEETINRYIDNELSAEELKDFGIALNNDPSLNEEIASLMRARTAIRLHGINNDVTAIRNERKNSNEAPVIKMSPNKKIIRFTMAAAAALLVLFFGVRLFNASETNAAKMFDEKYLAYEDVSVRSGTDPEKTDITIAYAAKDHRKVLDLFQTEKNIDRHDSLLAGVSALQLGNAIKSISILLPMSQVTKPNFKDDIQYYLSLAYLKQHNYANAVALMKSIHADKENTYHDRFDDDYISRVKRLMK